MRCVDLAITAVLWTFVAIWVQAGPPALAAGPQGGTTVLCFNTVSIKDDAQRGGESETPRKRQETGKE